MINVKNTIGGLIGACVSAVGMAISTEQLESIVSMICSITGVLITLVVCIIIPVIKWWNKAKIDGKIDNEELDELGQIIQKGEDDLNNKKKGE